jgi:hypothetical protein
MEGKEFKCIYGDCLFVLGLLKENIRSSTFLDSNDEGLNVYSESTMYYICKRCGINQFYKNFRPLSKEL